MPRKIFSRLRSFRFPFRLPVLTASEKFALLTLALLLAGGAVLRSWERSGVRIGPVEDWTTLRQLVIRARTDLKKREGEIEFACADEAAAGSFGAQEGSGPDVHAAGFGSMDFGPNGIRHDDGKRGPGKSTDGSRKKPPQRPVDLNAAAEKALLSLPGVGPSTAKAIVAYRTAHGKFRSVDDLLQVKGIGPKKLETLRPFARVQEAAVVPPDTLRD